MIGLLLVSPVPSEAASGGRIGGGNFQAPSIPRTGGYRGGYGGSYRGGYPGGYRRGYGGGIGYPFILPFFGFGGGGLFGFLILMTIAGVIVNAVRGNSTQQTNNDYSIVRQKSNNESVTMVQLQMGLLARAKDLKEDLRTLALSANTGSQIGLQKVLQESTLALLRQPDLWVYSNFEIGSVPFNSAESTFNRLSMNERSKLSAEIASNVSGQIITEADSSKIFGDSDLTSEYIAVTLLIATRSKLNLKEFNSSEELREILRTLGSITSDNLIALEVIWQPEGLGEVLSGEELVTSYPNLKHL